MPKWLPSSWRLPARWASAVRLFSSRRFRLAGIVDLAERAGFLSRTLGHDVAYRPLSRLSFYLDYQAFGWHAGAWHAENMALGAVAGSCLYALARNLNTGRLPSLLAALLFVVAPLVSDNIIWISGRTGLLCLIFILLAMLCWLRGFENPRWWILTAMLYVSGMMTYEPVLVLPLLLACLAPFVLD